MLMPKKVKYRKQQRGRRSGKAWRGGGAGVWRVRIEGDGAGVDHGPANRKLPRVAITRFIKRGGKLLDSHFSGQAVHEEACRDPHG